MKQAETGRILKVKGEPGNRLPRFGIFPEEIGR
jgi:hypothetical protein